MRHPQIVAAFIAALLEEGVDARTIDLAVMRVEGLRPGDSISGGNPLRREFAFGQADRLEKIP